MNDLMDLTEVQLVLQDFAKDIQDRYKDVLANNGHIASKKLMDSIQFLKTTDLSNEATLLASRNLPTESARMAVAIIALIPVLAIYPFIQKELIKGMVVGGVKG